MSELTVLCWLWNQEKSRAKYTAQHVSTWAAMVRRNLSMPHRIACVTDIPEGIDPSVEIIAPPGDFLDIRNPRWANGKPQCYRRLSMFRRDAAEIFGERFVCMDLDCVVGGPLDPLFDRDDDLVLFKGTSRARPYNGSMMMIRAGCRPQVFEDFNQAAALESGQRFCGSDQAWLMHKLGPGEATWSERDGVYWFGGEYTKRRRYEPRVVFFPGGMKPWTATLFDAFTRRNYRADLREAA
jgi:hypothetical protein